MHVCVCVCVCGWRGGARKPRAGACSHAWHAHTRGVWRTQNATPPRRDDARAPHTTQRAELHVLDGVPQTVFVRANYSMEVRRERVAQRGAACVC
jgi:hypothetical protein